MTVVDRAVAFLTHEATQTTPVAERIAFLRAKGMQASTIEEALRRSGLQDPASAPPSVAVARPSQRSPWLAAGVSAMVAGLTAARCAAAHSTATSATTLAREALDEVAALRAQLEELAELSRDMLQQQAVSTCALDARCGDVTLRVAECERRLTEQEARIALHSVSAAPPVAAERYTSLAPDSAPGCSPMPSLPEQRDGRPPSTSLGAARVRVPAPYEQLPWGTPKEQAPEEQAPEEQAPGTWTVGSWGPKAPGPTEPSALGQVPEPSGHRDAEMWGAVLRGWSDEAKGGAKGGAEGGAPATGAEGAAPPTGAKGGAPANGTPATDGRGLEASASMPTGAGAAAASVEAGGAAAGAHRSAMDAGVADARAMDAGAMDAGAQENVVTRPRASTGAAGPHAGVGEAVPQCDVLGMIDEGSPPPAPPPRSMRAAPETEASASRNSPPAMKHPARDETAPSEQSAARAQEGDAAVTSGVQAEAAISSAISPEGGGGRDVDHGKAGEVKGKAAKQGRAGKGEGAGAEGNGARTRSDAGAGSSEHGGGTQRGEGEIAHRQDGVRSAMHSAARANQASAKQASANQASAKQASEVRSPEEVMKLLHSGQAHQLPHMAPVDDSPVLAAPSATIPPPTARSVSGGAGRTARPPKPWERPGEAA